MISKITCTDEKVRENKYVLHIQKTSCSRVNHPRSILICRLFYSVSYKLYLLSCYSLNPIFLWHYSFPFQTNLLCFPRSESWHKRIETRHWYTKFLRVLTIILTSFTLVLNHIVLWHSFPFQQNVRLFPRSDSQANLAIF